MSDTFNRNVAISFIAHALIAILLLFRAVFIPSEPLDLHDAIRVDIVGLPEKMTEAPKLDAPAPKAQEPAKVKEPVKKADPTPAKPTAPTIPSPNARKVDRSKAQTSALNKLKADAALEKIKADLNKEKNSAKQGTVIKGNAVSEGNSLTGLQRLDYDRYLGEVKAQVIGHWNIPQWLADANLKASVQVVIDERGYVVKKILRKSSGNEVFDSKAMEAIDAASPLPPPPDKLRGLLGTSGVIFNFPE